MQRFILIALVASAFLSGCRTRYEVTLNNSNTITSVGKPKLRDGSYVFKDTSGRTNWIPSSRVRLIQPQSDASISQPGPFKPSL